MPSAARGDVDPAELDAGHELLEARRRSASAPPRMLDAGDPEAVEHELGGLDALVAELLQRRRDRQPRQLGDLGLLLDDERGHAGVARLGARVGDRQQHHDAGPQAVRDPHLLPVDHVVVAVAHRAGADRLHVGAGVGLGHRERRAHLAARHPRQQPVLLLGGAERLDHERRDEVRVDDARQRDPAARELLDDQRVRRQVEARARRTPRGSCVPNRPELPHRLHERRRGTRRRGRSGRRWAARRGPRSRGSCAGCPAARRCSSVTALMLPPGARARAARDSALQRGQDRRGARARCIASSSRSTSRAAERRAPRSCGTCRRRRRRSSGSRGRRAGRQLGLEHASVAGADADAAGQRPRERRRTP